MLSPSPVMLSEAKHLALLLRINSAIYLKQVNNEILHLAEAGFRMASVNFSDVFLNK
jgi:hypothetical protein